MKRRREAEMGEGRRDAELGLGERAAAASVGAVATALLMTPLDVAKVRLQLQASKGPAPGHCFVYSNGLMDHICTFCDPSGSQRPSTSASAPQRPPVPGPASSASASAPALTCEWYNRPPPPTPFRGTVDALAKIARYEGFRSLWSGLSPTLVIAMPATVGYFTLNDVLCARGKARFGDRFWVPMVAGSAARSAVVLVSNPVEMVRTKLQSQSLSYRDIGRAIQTSHAQEGFRVFWKGLTPTLGRDVVFTAVYWGLLDFLRATQIRREGRSESSFRISFTSGAASALVAAVVTNPMDVVKTRRQIELGEKGFRNGSSGAVRRILTELMAKEGWGWLWAGLAPRLAKVVPACAIMIASYDAVKAAIRRRTALPPP